MCTFWVVISTDTSRTRTLLQNTSRNKQIRAEKDCANFTKVHVGINVGEKCKGVLITVQ